MRESGRPESGTNDEHDEGPVHERRVEQARREEAEQRRQLGEAEAQAEETLEEAEQELDEAERRAAAGKERLRDLADGLSAPEDEGEAQPESETKPPTIAP